jgi:deazaflavin-dependent oxidoreductase (nitroreductase family)
VHHEKRERILVKEAHRVVAAPIDERLMRSTHGRLSTAFGAAPVVMLRTTGAKSGASRDVTLAYFTDGDDVVLIATNYGQAKHPSWYHNLLKNPECELFANGGSGRFVARATTGSDHDRLFSLAEGAYNNFRNYAASTHGIRSIPVLRLTPA